MHRLPRTLRLLGLGWYIAFCLVAGIVGGVWLDQRFNTRVLFLLLGLAIGLISAFYGTFRMLTRATDEQDG